jgi:hypothetical protein
MNSWLEITHLIYTYALYIDQGKLDKAAELFTHATVKIPGSIEPADHKAFLQLLQKVVIIYPDGTPKTRHLISNPMIEIDEELGKATATSTFTVLQQTEALPLQIVATGYYNDRFEKHNDRWRFSHRESTLPHIYGNIQHHINFAAQ